MQNGKNIKIFLSSTFKDMDAERDLIMNRVAPMLQERLAPEGITIQFIDLRWGVNTQDADEDERENTVLRECISEYYESTDPYGFPLRTPTYFRNSTGFCENFTDDYPTIIRESHTIKAQEKKVFLVSFYFEGNDPDCTKSSPEGSTLTFSAHFGG